MADRSVRVRLEANVVGFVAQVGIQAVAAVNKLEAAAVKANASLAKVGADAGALGTKIGAGATAATGHLDKLAAAADKNSAGFNTLASGATKMGLAAAAGLGLSAKAAIDWESAWTGVTKTVNGSTSQMAALEGQLRGMAKTLPVSHDQIAAVAEAAGQLGVKRQDIAGFTKTMVDLGISTNLSADEAATSIAQLMNVMGTAPQDVGRLGAALVALGNNGASTEKDIISMAQRISGSGKLIGLNEQQVLAYAAALANVGIEAEAGGTAISQVFTKIDKAVGEGGQGLSDFAKVSGMSADQYKQKWKTDASGATQAFIEGLGQIHKAGGDVNGTLATLGITEIRQRDAVLRLAESGTNLSDMLQTSNTGWRDNTALVNEASKRYATTASQIQIAWNNIKDAAITAGAATLPIIAEMSKSVASLATFFGNLPGPVQKASVGLLAIVAVGGLVIGAALKMLTGLAAARAAMETLGVTSARTGAALGALSKAGAVGAAVVGVLALTDALDKAFGNVPKGSVSQLATDLDTLGKTAVASGTLADRFGASLDGISRRGPDLKGLGETFKAAFVSDAPFTWMDANVKSVKAVDDALAQLVSSGNVAGAQGAFKVIADAAQAQGLSLEQVQGLLPGYVSNLGTAQAAADAAGTGAKDAATGTKALALGLDATASAADIAATELKNYIAALFLVPNLVLGVRDAQRGVQAAMDDATKSIKENGKTLKIATPEGRANQAALDAIATSANKLSESYLNSNATQKTMTKGAMDARASFIDLAHKMGMPIPAAKALAEQLIKIPKKTEPKVTVKVDISDLEAKLKTAKTQLADKNLTKERRAQLTATIADLQSKIAAAKTQLAHPSLTATKVAKLEATKKDLDAKIAAAKAAIGSKSLTAPPATVLTADIGKLLAAKARAQAAIDSLTGKTITVTMKLNSANIQQKVNNQLARAGAGQADGGFYPGGVPSYADGKMPDQAIIQQAVPGGLVQWAEPETQGEAFIPLAPSKRDRSTAILGQVASSFGLSLVKSFADGGFLPGGRLVDISLILKQLGVAFNPLAGINYGGTLAAQTKANAAVAPARAASIRANQIETAAKANVTDISRDITLQQRYIAQLKAVNPKTPKEQAANDAKVKQEQKDLIKLQDQLYAAKIKQKNATDASNKADATYKLRVDAAKKATEAHAAAIAKLVEQQKAAVDFADQISQGLQQGANIGDLFQQSLTGKGLLSDLQAQGADLAKFGLQITRLRKSGLSEVLIQQIVGKGPGQGMDLAQAIINGGKSLITALNAAQKNLDQQADLIGAGSAVQKYGQAVAGARALGGPTDAGKAYLVGENGPEILRMGSRPGWVDPNRYVTTGGGSGGATTVHHYHQTLQFTGVSMAEADLIAQRANAKAELMAKGY